MPKAAIYCRLSIEDRDKSDSIDSQSIQNQRAMLSAYCAERGWEIYDVYADDGYSGIDRSRPEFNRLLRDCEAGRIDIVLCKDQSRFSRDTVVIEQFINDRFLEWGVRFIGVADNADTDSESYSTMRLFASAYNEMYVKDISSKIRRTLAFKREQGQFIGSFAPYGYRLDPEDRHRLVPDEEAAPVVRLIFDMYVSGEGCRRIVKRLNDEGIASPTEYKRQKGSKYVNANADMSSSRGMWTQSTVARILRNEVYTGTLVQGKSHHISYKNKKRKKVDSDQWVRIPGAHEPVISDEVWQAACQRQSSTARAGRQSGELSPLSGKVRCAVCGRPMKRNIYYNSSKTKKYYGLQCASYKTGAMNCPNTRTISGIELEGAVLAELNSIVEQFCRWEDIHPGDIRGEQLRELEKRLADLSGRQSTAQKRLINMYRDRLDGIISAEDYTLFRQELAQESAALEEQTNELSRQLSRCRELVSQAENRDELIEQFTHFEKLDRLTADEFIELIEIGLPDENGCREVHIHWKI